MSTPRATPLKLGLIALGLAVAMLVTEVAWRPVFTIQLTESFALPLWVLAGIYGTLQLLIWRMTKRRLPLTVEELTAWGPKLEEVTPLILEAYQAHRPLGELAKELEGSHGLPPDITLRYIIALADHTKKQGQG